MASRIFLLFCLFAAVPAFAQQGNRSDIDRSKPPAEWEIPPAPVLTAEEALETFVLQPGFRIELVASEPLLQDPVAMDFDADGRIWVVEMQSFMPNVDGEGEIAPVSRVVVLEDTDGDGRMDESSTYMDNLILPRSIRVVAGGVLIGEPPHLWFTRDTDGDGRADEKTMVSDQYSHQEANPEHGANGLLYGLDNWIHDAMSDEGSFRMIDGEWVMRPTVKRGQWGISHDDYGRHFTNNNSHYLHADLVPNHYYSRNPNLKSGSGIFEAVDKDQSVWPIRITPGVNRRAHLHDDGYLHSFTAACSPLVYRGDRYPEEYYGNLFVAEPAGNFIRRSIVEEDENGFFQGRNAYEEDEFLASTDERFRPVNLYTAPDGTLYVLDMYRGILQHRQFVTTYLREQILDRDLDKPLGLGRIYRVVHESAEPGPAPRLSDATSIQLVKHLTHENGWWRDTAQRLLVERQDRMVVPVLKRMALDKERNEVARIHALWTLEGLDAANSEMLAAVLADPNPRLREAALRVSEPLLAQADNQAILVLAAPLISDESAPVRLQAVLSLGALPASNTKEDLLLEALRLHASQPFLVEAALSGLANRELATLESLLASSDWSEETKGHAETVSAFAAAVMREGNPANIDRLLTLAVSDGKPVWQNTALLAGVASSKITKLTERPAALDLEPAPAEIADRAAAVLPKLEWPDGAEEQLSPELELLASKGAQQYQLNCSACHQATGEGLPGLGKPLVGSKFVLGSDKTLIRIVLHGKEGEQGMMPPMGSLQDENIAAILSHVRRSWGNEADFVLAETVKAVRASSNRKQPWTEKELQSTGDD